MTSPSADRSVVHRLDVAGQRSFVRVGPRSISLGRGEDVLNWDRAGRPFAGNLSGVTWHRALDGGLVEIVPDGVGRRARWMSHDEIAVWAQTLRGWARHVVEAARCAAIGTAAEAFAPAVQFDEAAWRKDAVAFASVYAPVTILPPDQYLALVLQATLGCSWNRCTFCSLAHGRPYRERGTDEFAAHARAVRSFFGAGLAVRRSIFLGDANAIAAPFPAVRAWLRAVREIFPLRTASGTTITPGADDPPRGFDGVHGFLDVPGGLQRTPAEWATLAEDGLSTVYIGLESGHAPLLRLLGKPPLPDEVPPLVAALKSAKIAVGLVVLAGIGGIEQSDAHEARTAALVDSLALDRDDIVYVSPYVERPGETYRAREAEAGLTPLDEVEGWQQALRIRETLRSSRRDDGPRSALYDVRLFAY